MKVEIRSPKIYRFLDFVNKKTSSDTQRLIMGVTVIATQPLIDLRNKKIDEETRWTSVMRTIAKIIAGTTVGMFLVRGPVYKMVEKMTDINGSWKWARKLLPKTYIKELTENPNALRNYRSSIAMAISLGLMCITNFAIDAPLTMALTNFFNKQSGIKPENEEESNKNTKEMEVKDA